MIKWLPGRFREKAGSYLILLGGVVYGRRMLRRVTQILGDTPEGKKLDDVFNTFVKQEVEKAVRNNVDNIIKIANRRL